jgi:hypothetical protein
VRAPKEPMASRSTSPVGVRARRTWGLLLGGVVIVALVGCSAATGSPFTPRSTLKPVAHTRTSPPSPTPATTSPTPATATPTPPAMTATPTPSTVSVGWVGDTTFGLPSAPPPGGAATEFAALPAATLHSDVMLGNLETALGDGLPLTKCAPDQADCFAFEASTATARALKNAGFAGVNVANNHTRDAGAAGIAATDAALTAAGLSYAGRPGQISYLSRNGLTIALLGFAPYAFDDDALDIPAAQAQVRAAKARADLVIVMTHLGAEGDAANHVRPGEEHDFGEDRGNPIAFSHAVIDAGADLVIGSGPHVLRGMEWYHGHLIAYSLGDFAFYRNLPLTAEEAVTAALHVTLNADGGFESGDIVPLHITSPGYPAADASKRAVTMMNALSRSDFGANAALIGADGDIAPPQ